MKWVECVSPFSQWFEKNLPTATVREFDSKRLSLSSIRRSRRIPTRSRPTTAEPTRVSFRVLSQSQASKAAEVEIDWEYWSKPYITTPRRSNRKHNVVNTALFSTTPRKTKRRRTTSVKASNGASDEDRPGPSSSTATTTTPTTSRSSHVKAKRVRSLF